MLRRAALASLAVATLLVAACGHQVTPDPGSRGSTVTNNLSGHTIVRFTTNGPLDFVNYTYAIVIDACGLGEPYPQAYQTSLNSNTYAFLVGGQYGSVLPALFQYIITPGQSNSLNPQLVPANPSTESFQPNYQNANNTFQLDFLRQQLNNPKGVAQPCPTGTSAPSASPVAAPSGSPGASPAASGSPGASPSPSPSGASASPTPTSLATSNGQVTTWSINFFTISNTNATPVDSLGTYGAQDASFVFTLDTTKSSFNQITRPAGSQVPADPRAAIGGGEIDNYP